MAKAAAATGMVLSIACGTVATPSPASACGSEPYVGEVCTFAFNWCPRDFLPANGQQVSLQSYMALFGLIGTTYGGDGRNNFNLPDLQGRSAIGAGAGAGLAPTPFGQSVGQQQVTLGASQVPVAPHTHPATFTATMGKQTVPEVQSTLGVSVTLSANQPPGGNSVTPGAFLGEGASSGGGQALIYVPAGSTAPGVALGGASATVTGAAGHEAFDINLPTGGTVAVGNNAPAPATAAVPTQSPALAQTVCIAVNGLYPNRP